MGGYNVSVKEATENKKNIKQQSQNIEEDELFPPPPGASFKKPEFPPAPKKGFPLAPKKGFPPPPSFTKGSGFPPPPKPVNKRKPSGGNTKKFVFKEDASPEPEKSSVKRAIGKTTEMIPRAYSGPKITNNLTKPKSSKINIKLKENQVSTGN